MSANYFMKNLCPSEISEWFSERMGSSDGWTEIQCDYQRWIFWMENHPATDLWRMREIWIQEKMALCKNRTEWNLTKLKLCPIWNILFISWCSIRIHYFNIASVNSTGKKSRCFRFLFFSQSKYFSNIWVRNPLKIDICQTFTSCWDPFNHYWGCRNVVLTDIPFKSYPWLLCVEI